MLPLSFLFGFTVVLTFSRGKAVAALTNLIIDDTNQAYWTFIGSQWNAITPTTPCTACVTKPNAALAYNTTWHNSVLGSGSFSFQGTAVYIYGIDTPVQFSANISFQMDDPPTTSFHYYAGSDYVYNSLFFAATNLSSSVPHVVSWLTEASPTEGRSVLLDFGKRTESSNKSFAERQPICSMAAKFVKRNRRTRAKRKNLNRGNSTNT